MAEHKRRDREQSRNNLAGCYSATGHPPIEQLIAEQGTTHEALLQGCEIAPGNGYMIDFQVHGG